MTYELGGTCNPWITGIDLDCPLADPAILNDAAQAAVDALYYLTGGQFTGECTRTVRPGYRNCDCGFKQCSFPYWIPQWAYLGYSDIYAPFVCCDGARARLGFTPIISITSVTIDGVVFAPANYAVDEYDQLVRLDGLPWPSTDTWEVEFTTGVAPPTLGILAAKELGCEIAKLLSGADGCQLPKRVTNLTRQGVSIVFDPMEFLDNGKTGIYLVDLFISTFNPNGLHSSPTVALPNEPNQIVRHTWP